MTVIMLTGRIDPADRAAGARAEADLYLTKPFSPKELLDAWVPDRPVYFPNRDGHGSWANSLAFEVAGITAATPDPPDGRIERLMLF